MEILQQLWGGRTKEPMIEPASRKEPLCLKLGRDRGDARCGQCDRDDVTPMTPREETQEKANVYSREDREDARDWR